MTMDFNQKTYEMIYGSFRKKYGDHIGIGRHRITFESTYCVVKLPHNFAGMGVNINEYWMFNNTAYLNDQLARCKIVYVFGFPILLMQKLKTDAGHFSKPTWSCLYDCCQVGLTRKGDWKAYDYG